MYIHRYGGEVTEYYQFLKGFCRLAHLQTILQERIDKTLEFIHQVRLDDIIIVSKGNIEEYEMEVKETRKKLEEAGYRLHPKKAQKKTGPQKTKRKQTLTR